jgi:hypothetical protein
MISSAQSPAAMAKPSKREKVPAARDNRGHSAFLSLAGLPVL